MILILSKMIYFHRKKSEILKYERKEVFRGQFNLCIIFSHNLSYFCVQKQTKQTESGESRKSNK